MKKQLLKLKIVGALFAILCLTLPLTAQTIINPASLSDADLFGRDVAIQGNTMVGSTNNFDETNKVYAFRNNGSSWEEDGILIHANQVEDDQYGRSVDVYGDYAVVGAASDSDQGRAYVFKRISAGNWELDQTLVSSDIASEDDFGLSVSIHGTTILVGASGKGNGKGAAYVFEMQGDQWVETAKLVANTTTSSLFGHFSSLYGDYAAISAHQNEKVFIFKREGDDWSETKVLDSPDGQTNSFGVTNSIYQNRVLVGSLRDDEAANNAGAAYVYVRDGEDWVLEQKLIPSDGMDGRNFGGRISLGNRYAVIGTLYDADFYTGACYIFRRDGNTWTEIEKYTTAGDDYFGWSTAADENLAVVGAYAADINTLNGGAVYIYDLPDLSNTADFENQAFDLNVFPNPAGDFVNLEWPTVIEVLNFQLVDVNGRTIRVWEQALNQIDISNLPSGQYWIRVLAKEGIVWQSLSK